MINFTWVFYIQKISMHYRILGSVFLLSLLASCHDEVQTGMKQTGLEQEKISDAVSCTSTGLPVQDSALYMHGGGADYQPTIPGEDRKPGPGPEGMVWIPGGEFSMGGVNPIGMMDGGLE